MFKITATTPDGTKRVSWFYSLNGLNSFLEHGTGHGPLYQRNKHWTHLNVGEICRIDMSLIWGQGENIEIERVGP